MDIKKLAAEQPNILILSDKSIDTYRTHADMMEDATTYAKHTKQTVVVARVVGTVDVEGTYEATSGHEWAGYKDAEFIALFSALGRTLHELRLEKRRADEANERAESAIGALRKVISGLENPDEPAF